MTTLNELELKKNEFISLSSRSAPMLASLAPDLEDKLWSNLRNTNLSFLQSFRVRLGGLFLLFTVVAHAFIFCFSSKVGLDLTLNAVFAACVAVNLVGGVMSSRDRNFRWYYEHFERPTIFIFFIVAIACTQLFSDWRIIQLMTAIVTVCMFICYFYSGLRTLQNFHLFSITITLSFVVLFFLQMIEPIPNLWSGFASLMLANVAMYFIRYLTMGLLRRSFIQTQVLEIEKLQLSIMQEEISKLSWQDDVTELFNRRYFNKTIEFEFEKMLHEKEPLSLLMIDIDQFKEYNYAHGYLKGNEVLQRIANTLKTIARSPADLVAHFSSEKMVMLMPNLAPTQAQEVAQQLISAVDALAIVCQTDQANTFITVSVGVATAFGENQNLTIDEFISQADQALHAAKVAGRHRVHLFSVE